MSKNECGRYIGDVVSPACLAKVTKLVVIALFAVLSIQPACVLGQDLDTPDGVSIFRKLSHGR